MCACNLDFRSAVITSALQAMLVLRFRDSPSIFHMRSAALVRGRGLKHPFLDALEQVLIEISTDELLMRPRHS